ncbi:MAG: EAL domain-containing protein [Sphingomonadales bacterium]
MTVLNQILWILSYGTITAIVAVLANQFLDLAPVLAVVTGAVLFLFLIQVHAARNRRIERSELDARMMALREDYQSVTEALGETRGEMVALRERLEDYRNASSSELISELRVLETLLSQLTERRAGITTGRNDLGHGANAHAIEHGALRGGHASPPEPDVATGRDEILHIMHNALEENRVDLYLQPLVALPSRKVVSYEAFSRVRDHAGHIIFPRQYLGLAAESGLVGTLDNLLLFRCIQVIRRLGPRRPNLRFFCNISPASLDDADFFPQFMDFMTNNLELADRLVFEFAQADVRAQSAEVERSLSALGRRGFQFSMDQVTDLDLDVADLAARHFSYVKVSADAYLGGAPGHIHRDDLRDALARRGIDLVIEKIEHEAAVVEILDFGVAFGQGYLFGEPRPSRDDVHQEGELQDGDDLAAPDA